MLHRCNSVQWNFLLAGFDGKEEAPILYEVIFPALNTELKLLESQAFRMKQGTYTQSFRWKSDYKMLLLMQNRVSVMSKHFDGYGNATQNDYKVADVSLGTDPTSTFRVWTHEERVSLGKQAEQDAAKLDQSNAQSTIQAKLSKIWEKHKGQRGPPHLFFSDRIAPDALHLNIGATTHLLTDLNDFAFQLGVSRQFWHQLSLFLHLKVVAEKLKKKTEARGKDISKWRVIGEQGVELLANFCSLMRVLKECAFRSEENKQRWKVHHLYFVDFTDNELGLLCNCICVEDLQLPVLPDLHLSSPSLCFEGVLLNLLQSLRSFSPPSALEANECILLEQLSPTMPNSFGRSWELVLEFTAHRPRNPSTIPLKR
jgi:hypothetical protein